MPSRTSLKLSRRRALELLAATTAVTLTSLPDKWTKPVLQFGALPAHAQTSGIIGADQLLCGAEHTQFLQSEAFSDTSTVTISPALSGVSMTYQVVLTTGIGWTINTPSPLTGTALTNGSGQASVSISATGTQLGKGIIVTVTWGFTHSADGIGTCPQTLNGFFTA